jgi:hypothetical protein
MSRISQKELAVMVSEALRQEMGSGRNAAKHVMDWTGVCDRAARNWLAGTGGMSGAHLIMLARHSDAVWEIIIRTANRPEAVAGVDLHAVEVILSRALGSIEQLRRQAGRGHSARDT